MCLNRYIFILIFFTAGITSALPQDKIGFYKIHFPKSAREIDSIMSDNPNYNSHRDSIFKAIENYPEYSRRIIVLKTRDITDPVSINSLYLKSNLIALGGAIANVALEIDIAPHFSINIPLYYSAWDYFRQTVKFRTFALQPELRYWISDENEGLFGGVHLGMAYYNIALDGKYRYQDHKMKTPSIGGGFCIGYRFPLSVNKLWNLEFTLGGGVYHSYYDKFNNTSRTSDGLLVGSKKNTYVGIDQASVSICYKIESKNRGGEL